jgi:hypothetical protein
MGALDDRQPGGCRGTSVGASAGVVPQRALARGLRARGLEVVRAYDLGGTHVYACEGLPEPQVARPSALRDAAGRRVVLLLTADELQAANTEGSV